MIDLDDNYSLGLIAGIIANTVRIIFAWITFGLNFRNYFTIHLASSAVLNKEEISTLPGLFIGVFTDYAIAGILGIVTIYLLHYTTTKNYILKGLSVGSMAWLLIYIPITQTKISRINPEAISSNIVFLLGHLLLGVIMAVVIVKYREWRA